jgi:hypothetical protein
MALSVQKGVYNFISVQSQQSISGEVGAGAANLSLSTSFPNFTLAATATAAPAAAVGGGYPLWWPAYVRAELARQAAKRESLALQLDEIRIVGPLPFAAGEVEAVEPPIGDLLAVVKLPRVEAEIFVPRLIAVIEHDEPADDEAAMLFAASLLLAA